MKKPIILKKFLRRCKKKSCIKATIISGISFCLLFIMIIANNDNTVPNNENCIFHQTNNELSSSSNEETLSFSATVSPLTLNNSFSSFITVNMPDFNLENQTNLTSEITTKSDDGFIILPYNENYIFLEEIEENEEETTTNIEENTTIQIINHDNTDINSYINELINYYSSYDTRIELNADNIYLLARLSIAESEGECFEGKVAVCEVVINRTISYNQTISEIIFARNPNGTPQFSCIDDGRINLTPRNEDILAAVMAIIGEQPTNGSLYFDNPTKSPNSWASRNREKSIKIGDHQFYY